MSSREGRAVDGGIGIGGWEMSAQPAIGDPEVQSSDTYSAALSLDEAEDIAARRLRELAIRLGDDDDVDSFDADTDSNGTPFDADRHFRSRLALRIAGHTPDAIEERSEEPDRLPFLVTEALPLSAFGERFAVMSRVTVATLEQHAPAAVADASDTQASHSETVSQTLAEESAADEDIANYSVRLSDLIAEQRLLLDRLSGLSAYEHELERDQFTDSLPRSADEDQPADDVSSDAHQLFEVGTYSAEPLVEEDDALAQPAISAEQLIAALREAEPALSSEGRFPSYGLVNLSETVVEHARAPVLDHAHEAVSDRPPMIIERARAELTAQANGEAAFTLPEPSRFFGFAAGLSLSLVVGISLYLAL